MTDARRDAGAGIGDASEAVNLTRRKMLGVAAVTAATAVSTAGLATAAVAQTAPAAPTNPADLALFVKISAALTGIVEAKLAPAVDPVFIRQQYFDRASKDPQFADLMQIVRADPSTAAEKIMADLKLKYLGRSIILAWYLGAWYAPATLAQYDTPKQGVFPVVPVDVISPAAYTQAWTWRVAQAHPMGYSELRFGYWSEDPIALDDLTGLKKA